MDVTFYENQPYYPNVGIQGEQPNTYPTENSEYQPLALEITELALLLHNIVKLVEYVLFRKKKNRT